MLVFALFSGAGVELLGGMVLVLVVGLLVSGLVKIG
jgi:hypothetical protein